MKIADPTAKFGEDEASKYLTKLGYKIIERNFRKGYGELDIIAIDSSEGKGKEILVFVEVKTRRSNYFGTPLEAITYWKLKEIVKTAQFYKLLHPNLPDALRIDAVSVKLLNLNEVESIELTKNISGF